MARSEGSGKRAHLLVRPGGGRVVRELRMRDPGRRRGPRAPQRVQGLVAARGAGTGFPATLAAAGMPVWSGLAAARAAQSRKNVQDGNAAERQYASWCASARGCGVATA